MPFRDSILAISAPSYTAEGGTAEAIQYSEGLLIDGIAQWMIEGVKASMPLVCGPDALYLSGRDMQIDRGPNETDEHYAVRLSRAVDSHRVKGSGPELCLQLLSWFSPSTSTPIRIVSNSAVWHEINTTTEVVTKTVVGTNWNWDTYTSTRWWRGWVVIDASAGPWTADVWDLVGTWGDGGVWGSDATVGDVAAIRRIVDKWKPAHLTCVNIIVAWDATLYTTAAASPPNPDGTANTAEWQATQNASFWPGVT
jgi:hypothetical protein